MKSRPMITALLAVALLLTACNLPTAPKPTQEGIASTLAAQTLQVMMTQAENDATATPLVSSTPAPATPSPVPTRMPPPPSPRPVTRSPSSAM